MKNPSKTTVELAKDTADPKAKQQAKQQPWSLTKTMIVVIGACCVVSAFVNLLHAHGMDSTHDDTAMHQAMKEFMEGPPDMIKRKKSEGPPQSAVKVEAVAVDVHQEEEEEPPERGGHHPAHDMEEDSDSEDHKAITSDVSSSPRAAHLSCQKHGGPEDEFAQEMVYWQDIPSDARYVSPFHSKKGQQKRYMTFEPDGGGWNNIRMAMETVLGLGIATGRTLVLPPMQRMYLLGKDRSKQKSHFSFADFFPMEELARENDGLEIISMKEFLETEAMTGNMRHKITGKVVFPPDNRTDWEGEDVVALKEWLRNATHTPLWAPGTCMAAFPASGEQKDAETLEAIRTQIGKEGRRKDSNFLDDPPPVDSTITERMRESLAGRSQLCVYDEEMQKEKYVHFMCYHKMRVRMLVHFYAFLFFEDWREDLWMKRFMRDHVRYTDEIQCAAARVVHAIREHAREHNPTGNPDGLFDTFHVRRGDFQFKQTRISAEEIYENTKDLLSANVSVFIATDERDKKFFAPLREHYDVMFLDDFKPNLVGVNTNYYGMIDQLVASRGRLFFGCWHSTFTGFINRIRGYVSVKVNAPGSDKGMLPDTYYYTTLPNKYAMHKYARLYGAFFNREFPTSWRDLDKGIGKLPNVLEA